MGGQIMDLFIAFKKKPLLFRIVHLCNRATPNSFGINHSLNKKSTGLFKFNLVRGWYSVSTELSVHAQGALDSGKMWTMAV